MALVGQEKVAFEGRVGTIPIPLPFEGESDSLNWLLIGSLIVVIFSCRMALFRF